jgi:thioredoxin
VFDLHVTTPLDLEMLRSAGMPVIIDFGADSCIPCKAMAPVLAELNTSLAGRAIIQFVDVWKYRDLAQGIPMQVIPTQVFFDADGEPFSPPESLEIQFRVYTLTDTGEHVFTTHEGGLDEPQLLAILDAMGME